MCQIDFVDQFSQAQMFKFLKCHEEYTLFLQSNFENFGAKLSEKPHSGNFKIIREADKIVGVFCLTRKGNLLIESKLHLPILERILESCLEEPIPITAVLGRWEVCYAFWELLLRRKIIRKKMFEEKNILYTIELSKANQPSHSAVRILTEADYDQWKPLRIGYVREIGFPDQFSHDELHEIFLDRVKRKIIWGFFKESQLVSIADLNARASNLGQLGGVFTDSNFRKKGYSRAIVQQILNDAKKLHGIQKLIIFTGEKNFPAKKLYESLGAKCIGQYGLFFGK